MRRKFIRIDFVAGCAGHYKAWKIQNKNSYLQKQSYWLEIKNIMARLTCV